MDKLEINTAARWPDPMIQNVTRYQDYPWIPPIFEDQTVCGFFQEEKGVWASNGNGLFFIGENKTATNFNTYQHEGKTFPTAIMFEIIKDDFGHLWLGGARGLQIFDPLKKEFIQTHLISGEAVFALMRDKSGMIWAGATKGLRRFDPDGNLLDYFEFSADDTTTLSHNMILDIIQDSQGRIWISTMGGGFNLYHPDEKNFTRYDTSDGLLNNYVYGMLEDKKGNLWLSTAAGPSRFDIENETFESFDLKDDLDKDGLNQLAFTQLHGGYFAAGTSNAGLVIFHPDSLDANQSLPKTHLTELKVNYKPVTSKDKLLEGHSLFELPSLSLMHKHKSVVFEFAAFPYAQPQQLHYKYRLKGFDDEWVVASNARRVASYTNLPAGKFIFEACACRDTFCDEANMLSLPITVAPPFWATWWFRLGCLLLFSILLIAIVRFRDREIYRKKLEEYRTRQRLQRERERISRDLHDNIGAQLTQIVRSLDVITFKGRSKPFDEIEQPLENVIDHARDTMQLLRETIWAIQEESISILDFAQKIKDYLSKYFGLMGRSPEWEVSVKGNYERTLSPAQALSIFRVVQEATQNIVKHAEAEHISILISAEKDMPVSIRIVDDGKGMDLEKAKSLNGHYGLKNMEKRMEDIGGEMMIESSVGAGTRLEIVL